jgi:signal transduction histidine kinase
MRFPWRTLRGRLALASIAGLLAASVAFAVLGVELVRSQTVADEKADLTSKATAIARLMTEDAEAAVQTAGEYKPTPARILALEAIAGKGATLVYQGANLNPSAAADAGGLERVVLEQVDLDRLDAGRVQEFEADVPGSGAHAIGAAAAIQISGEPVGAAVLLREQSELVSVWRRFANRVLIAALIGLAFAMIVAVVFTRRAMRPLKRLQTAAIDVGRGDLDTRVEPSGMEEIDALATAFNTMVREIQHRETVTRDFLMRVTHDLRTPLTAIRGHTQALSDGVVPPEAIPRSLSAIDDESMRLDALVTDLLDLAKLEARRFRLDLSAVDSNELVDRAFHAFTGEAARRGMVYERSLLPLPNLYTDESRVRQIVGNLIDNALRWTPDGGTVRVSAHPRTGGGAVISVTDSGPGIAPDRLDEIFEPFRSENTPDGQHGSGLGLAISRQLARALGGDLRVESRIGAGSRFTLELPEEARQPLMAG